MQLRGAAEKLHDILGEQEFVAAFEQYDEYAGKQFDRAWKEFVETLILPSPGSDQPIRNTGVVSNYLNETTIIFPKVDFRFYHSVPNILTGMGILGTFIGLAVGVGSASSGLSSSVPSEIIASMHELLEGASLAFYSSIAGIFLSIIFVGIERRRSRKLHLALREWVDELEKRLRLTTDSEISHKQLEEAKRATAQLERFNTELIFSIQEALEEKIAGRLVPHLERLVEAMDGLRSDRASDAGRMIETSLGQFTAAMQEQTGSQFEEMASIVRDLNVTLKHTSDGFSQKQQDIHTTMDSVIENMKTSMYESTQFMTETLHQSLSGITDIVKDASKQVSDQMSASSNAAAEELGTTIRNLTKDLARTSTDAVSQISGSVHGLQEAADGLSRSTQQSEKILASMTSFVELLNRQSNSISTSHRQIITMSEQLGQVSRDIQISSERSADSVEQTTRSVTLISDLVERLDEHQKSTADAWTQYQERFENIDASLANVFGQIDEGLSRYCEQVEKFSITLDRTFSEAIKNLAGAIGEFNESIEELIPRLPGDAK